MKKVGISIGQLQTKYGDKEALRIAKSIGADAVQFNTCDIHDISNPKSVYSKSRDEITAYFKDLKEYADELGIVIDHNHGRIEGFKNDREIDSLFLKNAELDCLATRLLGAPACVFHSVTTIFLGPDAPSELMHDLNFEMFNSIIPFAKENGIKIASETFGDAMIYDCCDFFGNTDEFEKSYNRVCNHGDNADYMTICVDTGHSNKASRFNNNPSPGDVIRRLGKNVTLLHLNDNNKISDQHLIPFTSKNCPLIEGTIDWEDVMNALNEIGYEGIYNMEIVLNRYGEDLIKETAEFAIKVLKNYIN